MKRRNLIQGGLLVVALFAIYFFGFMKPDYKNPQKMVSYMWSNTQDGTEIPRGVKDLKIGHDSILSLIADINYSPVYSNKRRLSIDIYSVNGDLISSCTFEHGISDWRAEETDGVSSTDRNYGLRPINEKEEKLIRLAYKHFE